MTDLSRKYLSKLNIANSNDTTDMVFVYLLFLEAKKISTLKDVDIKNLFFDEQDFKNQDYYIVEIASYWQNDLLSMAERDLHRDDFDLINFMREFLHLEAQL